MENPTLEQMEAWRDQATERLSLFSRSNAIEEPIGIGEECYQLGEDCYKPTGTTNSAGSPKTSSTRSSHRESNTTGTSP